MASKYIQVDLAWRQKTKLLSLELGCSQAEALMAVVSLWSSQLEMARPEDPPSGVITGENAPSKIAALCGISRKKPSQLCVALEAVGYLEALENGFRVRGISRYVNTFSKSAKDSDRMRKYRESLKTPPFVTRDVRVTLHERSGVDGDGDGDGDKDLKNIAPSNDGQVQPAKKSKPKQTQSGELATATPSRKRVVSDALVLEFERLRKARYKFNGAKDGKALDEMLKVDPEGQEILRRWRVGLQGDGWYRVDTLAALAMKWNELASPPKAKTKSSIFLDEDYYANLRPEDMTL